MDDVNYVVACGHCSTPRLRLCLLLRLMLLLLLLPLALVLDFLLFCGVGERQDS
jgi:hypothetical protein